ncbi:hypothetical protein [Nevskia ramosa]|uniref:hypothetical protein n=1 Tax=Nevskia ramosa TaxID=64002 RepID=UPI0012EC198D|nr:hypothetical protein [Nevskia ramosa]
MNDGGQTSTGKLFTQVYRQRTEKIKESDRFKRRIAGYLSALENYSASDLRNYLRIETGHTVPIRNLSLDWDSYFKAIPFEEVLDQLTLIGRQFLATDVTRRGTTQSGSLFKDWHNFISRAIEEENLSYSVDKKCGLHYSVDEHFSAERQSIILGLSGSRYQAVRKAIEESFGHFEGQPQDLKSASRSIFEAAETLTKIMFPGESGLNSAAIKNSLTSAVNRLYSDDPIAVRFSAQIVRSFDSWVNAVHVYRHGQQTHEPISVPIELATAALSAGVSFIRWLAFLDEALIAKGKERTSKAEPIKLEES